MDGRTDGRMENLPILQDFVPYQGPCPVTPSINFAKCHGGTDGRMDGQTRLLESGKPGVIVPF